MGLPLLVSPLAKALGIVNLISPQTQLTLKKASKLVIA